ncbi:hypothetical protein N5U31_07555 [Aliarcobacter butzleri]|uniref:hypothetical protein n=1 Tax=Aliarcobacter butzleri TaxID=28197 RepID=UPI0021B5BBE0|nr:hypothetical protein [Aliarcobacter butzleri]MCT7592819.1 hypothetical protein [Aliarcobacter butzleri]
MKYQKALGDPATKSGKNGSKFESENFIHHDCSNCTIPHKEKFIKKNFNKNWFEIMKDCRI